MKACVDIGGTKVAVCIADVRQASSGHPADRLGPRVAEPTAKTGAEDALARQVLRLIDQACEQAGVGVDRIDCVGVSSCGPFVHDEAGGIALATPNICGGLAGPARGLPNDWMPAPVQTPLAARFARVRVANDGIAALEAERRWGALQGVAHCAYVTWSTGVGAALCVDGRVLLGKNGNAGHAGHIFVSDDDNSALCGCGNHGDVESLVAGNAIERRFGRDAEALMSAAAEGQAQAVQTVDALCRTLGRALYDMTVLLDLERISLGGSVFWHNREWLLPRLSAQINGKLPSITDGVQLVAAGLGDQVGDYGPLALMD